MTVTQSSPTWKLAPGASAAWQDPTGRWLVYQRDGSWIARDYTLPADPREHRRDQERAFYSWPALLAFLGASGAI